MTSFAIVILECTLVSWFGVLTVHNSKNHPGVNSTQSFFEFEIAKARRHLPTDDDEDEMLRRACGELFTSSSCSAAMRTRAATLAAVETASRVNSTLAATQTQSYGTFREAESEELSYAPTKRVTFAPAEPTFMTTFTLRRDAVKDAMASAEESERTVARLVGMLGGSLKSFYVTQTGSADGVLTYTFPKNHDSRTFTCLLRSVAKFETIDTVKLMTSVDAAQCAKAAAQVEKALRK